MKRTGKFSHKNGQSIEQLLDNALSKHSNELFDEALLLYDLVLNQESHNVIALYNKGSILLAKDSFREASSCFRRILSTVLDAEKRFEVLCRYSVSCFASAQEEEAKRACAEALVIATQQLSEILALGGLCYEHGMKEQAAACYQRASEIDPDNFMAWFNLGLIHYEYNRPEEAVAAYGLAQQIKPDDPDLLFNFALSLVAVDEFAEALICYHALLEHWPEDEEVFVLMADSYRKLHQLEEAISCYRSAIGIRPDHGQAWAGLGVIFHLQERMEEAVQAFTNAKDAGHDPDGCAHILAALTGSTPEKPPEKYVEQLFDKFADDFDEKLSEHLEYTVPELIRNEIDNMQPSGGKLLLDLGCGTGLIGTAFVDWAEELVGVDLSSGMLAKADEKGIYGSLYQLDIVEFLKNCSVSYDLIVAADVLIYIGDLRPFFMAVVPVMGNAGRVIFTVESGEFANGNYVLQPNGRYLHQPEYLHKLAKEVGLRVEVSRDVKVRKEKGRWVNGHLVCLSPGNSLK